MSDAVETLPSAQQDAVILLPLMREYRDTLEKYCERIMLVNGTSNWDHYLQDKLSIIMPLVEKIASNASGLLEHTELDFLTERELKLRLTELEVLFKHYHEVIAPKKK
jgi:hypothetical protein